MHIDRRRRVQVLPAVNREPDDVQGEVGQPVDAAVVHVLDGGAVAQRVGRVGVDHAVEVHDLEPIVGVVAERAALVGAQHAASGRDPHDGLRRVAVPRDRIERDLRDLVSVRLRCVARTTATNPTSSTAAVPTNSGMRHVPARAPHRSTPTAMISDTTHATGAR